MPTCGSFNIVVGDDGLITLGLTPETPVGGWSVEFDLMRRFGADPFIVRTCASGFGNGVSGVSVYDSGRGIFQIPLNSQDTSGLDPLNIAFKMVRTDSGERTTVSEGFVNLNL